MGACDDIYSRSEGLIENGALLKKRVLIIGLGSLGSVIAVDLAKAAGGEVSLIDRVVVGLMTGMMRIYVGYLSVTRII